MKLKKAIIIEEVNETDYYNFIEILGSSLMIGFIFGVMIGILVMESFNLNDSFVYLIAISFSYIMYVYRSYEYIKENKVRKIEKEVYIKQ